MRDRWRGGGCGGTDDDWLFRGLVVACECADGDGEDDGVVALS